MNRRDLFEGIGAVDEEILERSEKNKKKRNPYIRRWVSAVAAMLVITIGVSAVLGDGSRQVPDGKREEPEAEVVERNPVLNLYAIEQASYPEMVRFPEYYDYMDSQTNSFDYESYDEAYEAWWESAKTQHQREGYAEGLEEFWTKSIQEFLTDSNGENRVYSPINVYMALGMLAELTEGDSRQQILDLMNADSIEALRDQANVVWNEHYQDDGATTSILASSLWLNEDVSFLSETMNILKENYYASSYQGKMGSPEFDEALQAWLNEQTGNLLNEQVQGVKMSPETILALATTVHYRAKWGSEFHAKYNTKEMFHAEENDVECEFMHSSWQDTYYAGAKFGAIGKDLENSGGTMWFLLPDEGVSVDEMLTDADTMNFLLQGRQWENKKELKVNLSLPKFDVSSQIDLNDGLRALGITDVFDRSASNFKPMTTDMEGIYVAETSHNARVAIDEQGVVAVAYTLMRDAGAAIPPEEEIDFILNRPFLFAIMSDDGLPLFVGVINTPNENNLFVE